MERPVRKAKVAAGSAMKNSICALNKAPGVIYNKERTHAAYKTTHNGTTYLFNGNDSEEWEGETPSGLPPDGFEDPPYFHMIRHLANRPVQIQLSSAGGGLCAAVANGLARLHKRYQAMYKNRETAWQAFLDHSLVITEEELMRV